MSRAGRVLLVAGLTACAYGMGSWISPRGAVASRGLATAPPHPAAVPAPDGIRQASGVPVGAVEAGLDVREVRLQGRVAVDERRVRVMNAAMEGNVVRLSGATAGSWVREGQWLGAIFSADLRPALQAHLTALEVHDRDPLRDAPESVRGPPAARNRSAARFAEERLLGFGVSRRQVDELSSTRELPMEVDLYAPTTGIVLARPATVGTWFDRGAEWFRIANLDRVWIVVELPSGPGGIAPGTAARVSVPGRPGSLPAVVSAIPAWPDPATGKLLVRLEAENPGLALHPDEPVDVIVSVARPEGLTVPVGAVVDGGRRRTVFVETGDGVFEARAVETGWRAGDRVQVLSGLAPGERIALSGAFLVDAESRVPAVP